VEQVCVWRLAVRANAVKTDERLTFIHKPGTGIQVDVNGTVNGTIKGDNFAKAFLAILQARRISIR
jgi:hypothetical protein